MMNQIGTSCFFNYHEPNNFITFLVHTVKLKIFCMYTGFWVHTVTKNILHLYGADGKQI
jgi:hypothetical protein